MRTKPIIASAVVAMLLLNSLVFITARPSTPAITVRDVKSVQSGRVVSLTFEITNHTTRTYFLYSISGEVRKGPVWDACFDFGSFSSRVLGPHGSEICDVDIPNLPTGSPLRLRLWVGKELAGLEHFLSRLNLRFRQGHKNVPLNPFDKSITVFSSKLTQVVSDEFVEPGPEPTSKANSGK